MGFPPWVLPVVLLSGAVLIDVSVPRRVPGGAAALVVTAGVYAAGAAQATLDLLPPWNWWSALPVAVGFGALWAAVDVVAGSERFARWKQPVEPFRETEAAPVSVGTGGPTGV